MEVHSGWSTLTRWKQVFVVLMVGILPLRELWNWWLVISRFQEMDRIYVRPPLPSLVEIEVYYSVITWYGMKAALRVLRHEPGATKSALSYLRWYLSIGILIPIFGGFVFPLPPVRSDLGVQFNAMRTLGYLENFTIHLLIFGTFYTLFRRAKFKELAEL